MESEDNRKPGVLTRKDRAYIKGKKEYESRQGRNTREREMVNRLRNGLRDYELVLEEMGPELRKRFLNQNHVSPNSSEPDLRDPVISTIALLLDSAGLTMKGDASVLEASTGNVHPERNEPVESILEDAICRAYWCEHKLVEEIELQYDVSHIDREEIIEILDGEKRVTEHHIKALLRCGLISPSEILEQANQNIEDENIREELEKFRS